jgi:hypothetical protein
VCSPLRAISHEVTEFEFHISPAPSSSRPQTGVGTWGTRSSSRCARTGSSVKDCGLSTASPTSGIAPPCQQRTSYRKIRRRDSSSSWSVAPHLSCRGLASKMYAALPIAVRAIAYRGLIRRIPSRSRLGYARHGRTSPSLQHRGTRAMASRFFTDAWTRWERDSSQSGQQPRQRGGFNVCTGGFSTEEAREIGEQIGIDWSTARFDVEQFPVRTGSRTRTRPPRPPHERHRRQPVRVNETSGVPLTG